MKKRLLCTILVVLMFISMLPAAAFAEGAECIYEQKVSTPIDSEKLKLELSGKIAGKFTFAQSGDGWSIMNNNGRYLTAANGRLVLSKTAFEWDFENGMFSTSVKTTQKHGGWGFWFWHFPTHTREVTTTYYLSSVKDGAKLSTHAVDTCLYQTVEGAHDYEYVDCKNGTHDQRCKNCGEKTNAAHSFDPETHYCVCGAYDPEAVEVKISVTVSEKGGLRRFFHNKQPLYSVTIEAEAVGAEIMKIEYSDDNGRTWHKGTHFTSKRPIAIFVVRVIDSNGTIHTQEYDLSKTYTITFDMNGQGVQIEPMTDIKSNTIASKPEDPTAVGYTFAGWYVDSTLENEWNFNVNTITCDTTLYAKWIADTYTITLDSNGGIGGSESTTIEYNATATAAFTEPTPQEGYVLDGWYTDATNGTKVLNNDGTCVTDVTDYTDANGKWVKVITESSPVTLSARWETEQSINERDTDKDELEDYLEEYFGTDPKVDDTDNDGLTDSAEIYKTQTDPLKVDSDENGVSDFNEDLDGDGLTNGKEISIGTDVSEVDTDGDGLSDFNEVEEYGTNPVKVDTDGDGLSDSEEILLGLNPCVASTDGVTIDSSRLFMQNLSNDVIDESLCADNLAVPNVVGNVPGDINKHVNLDAVDIGALDDNRAIIGKQVVISSDYPESKEYTLTFTFDDMVGDFTGYMVCTYKDGDVLPCDTILDTNGISANVAEGLYFVVDAEQLLIDIGIPIRKYKNAVTSKASVEIVEPEVVASDETINDVSDEWYEENYYNWEGNTNSIGTEDRGNQESIISTLDDGSQIMLKSAALFSNDSTSSLTSNSSKPAGQADIVFVIDTTGSMSSAINNVVKNVDSFVDTLSTEYSVNAQFALIDFKDITCSETTVLVKNGSSAWFNDASEFKNRVNSLLVTGGGDGPETPIDALGMAHMLDFRSTASKFIILITDADYKANNNYGISSMDEMSQILVEDSIITSVISASSYESIYHNLYTDNDGVFGNIYGDFQSIILQLAEKIGEVVNDGSWVILNDYQFIKLDQPLDDSGYSSDGDTLSDKEELGDTKIKDVKPYIDWVLNKYAVPEGMYDDSTTVEVYYYKSNPILTDTDFDGRDDDKDKCPKDGSFNGTLHTNDATSKVNGTMDYRCFFNSNSLYNPQLSTVSLLLSAAVYSKNQLNLVDSSGKESTDGKSIEDVLSYYGMEKPTKKSITAEDSHLSEVGLGYHTIEYNNKIKTVVAIVIRGTNGTIEEWTSNFDIGDISTFDSTSEWVTKDNHKGFDITANRILTIVNNYINEHTDDENFNADSIVYWVTGHSRGAAIANIIGAYLQDEGKTAFTYTFAAPNTTLTSESVAGSYIGIFNVINSDDFVPCLPIAAWGYNRYGKTASMSIAENYESEWENLTDIWDYNPDSYGMQKTVDAIGAIIPKDSNPEEECYKYTCKDHGDGSNDTITIINRGMSEKSREKAIAKIPSNALPYCQITRYEGNLLGGWNFEVCQTPAYFMQIIAANISGEIGNYRFVVELDIAERYEDAKSKIVSSALGGIKQPHWTESYYLLSKNVISSNFK